MYQMSFRQIHLDFHTSEKIKGIGEKFNKEEFQQALKDGHVSSINLFAKCHHGMVYYQDAPYAIHPHLSCDLTRDMVAACKEIGVKTQIYISAGLDELMAKKHPEWLFRLEDQRCTWSNSFLEPGYHVHCMNTGYLNYLIEQIEHVTRSFDTDGIWLDIVGVRDCYCATCLAQLEEEGGDPENKDDIRDLGERVYKKYLEAVKEAVHKIKPEMEIFHNSGHVTKGRRDIIDYYSHIELESLPTGGWGYDHFPLSARYVQGLGKDFLGMTGKFHNTWGEFGGFKHPNALRYEAALNLAHGAKVCIGDQMHPDGVLDPVTYKLIGTAYKEVEEKEAWCDNVKSIADIALFSQECVEKERENSQGNQADAGAVRMLTEGKYLFDVIDDQEENLNGYKVIILPDTITLDEDLTYRLQAYVAAGGKVLATGKSGLNKEETGFMLDFGVTYVGNNQYQPDYFIPRFSYHGLGSTAFVMYGKGYRVEKNGGEIIGEREDSYFNRAYNHFSSHQHTPNEKGTRSIGISVGQDGAYIAWGIFDDYAKKGSLILKDMFMDTMDQLLGDEKTIITNLPAQGVVTLQYQEDEKRYINHLLYAVPTRRGTGTEVIEDILPVYDIELSLNINEEVKNVYLAPSGETLAFKQVGNRVEYTVKKLECHQMVVLEV